MTRGQLTTLVHRMRNADNEGRHAILGTVDLLAGIDAMTELSTAYRLRVKLDRDDHTAGDYHAWIAIATKEGA